ncbi:cytochrome P450 [Yinghuangia sp. ASG 101]|uniref:cytochrome P450 n=1 Tax=Yinghuangia sp. ASG 101 TaxID=2896848 RepID=UPI001E3A4290|nr:cytochrome P450 [Yinghuangia sp. ASG 101]UGQ12482.1 cytochrome P450 [Yinghuangia sp. ASG 101]
MSDYQPRDFFADLSVVTDPYPHFDELRSRCPVHPARHPGVMEVTGYDEAVEIYRDTDAFSSCNSLGGPFPGLPVEVEGDDADALIEQYRGLMPMSEFLVTMDGADHSASRGLLRRLLTPNRLKANEEAMWDIANRHLDEFIANGTCELIRDYVGSFSNEVIADLLGVPDEDRPEFREQLDQGKSLPSVEDGEKVLSHNPLEYLHGRFAAYVEDRRAAPREDVLTQLATATYPDGTLPEVDEIVRTSTFLFAAGGDTTGRLITAALRIVAENPDIQAALRADRSLIPMFIEEVLRLESPTMSDFRMARKTTEVGGVRIPAGTSVMIHPGAANRDPRRFPDPAELRIDRPNVREHIAFGRGNHSCPGGPLARVEAKVTLECFLDRTADIRISEAHHGPADAREFTYEPLYILRGLAELHLEFTPAG